MSENPVKPTVAIAASGGRVNNQIVTILEVVIKINPLMPSVMNS